MNPVVQIFILVLALVPVRWARAETVPSCLRQDFRTISEAISCTRGVGRALQTRHDHRGLFPQIYALTIESTARMLAQRGFQNPDWVTRLVVNYANIYRRTLELEMSGRRSDLPRAWRDEFKYATASRDEVDWKPDFDVIFGIHVHIERDLIEALFVTPTLYDRDSVRQDFLRITDALRETMPQIWGVFSSYSDVEYALPGVGQSLMNRWIAALRVQVWERASRAHTLSAAGKKEYLDRIDADVARRSYSCGGLLPLLPLSSDFGL